MERERVDSLVELAAQIAGKADEIDDLIVIYSLKPDRVTASDAGLRCLDNGIEIRDALYLLEAFKHWLLQCVTAPRKS